MDLLVENAGIWPQRYAQTRQGHEIAFGVNVLAHFVLRSELGAAGALGATRIVMLTGDIYILASACTPDYRWSGRVGGLRAYCRSKLGNLWIAAGLVERSPGLEVRVVHPGVVATGLGGDVGTLGALFIIAPVHAFNLKYFEERELELRYRGAYSTYKQKVPFLVPRFGQSRKVDHHA